jgi:hypothetical protein
MCAAPHTCSLRAAPVRWPSDLSYNNNVSPNNNARAVPRVRQIGLMGGPAKKIDPETGKAKAVPGVSIFVGGRVGEAAHLSLEPYKRGVPMADDDLLPELVEIAKEHFGATDK